MQLEKKVTYKTIRYPAEGFFKDKNSRFFAYAFPVSTEAEISRQLDILKATYRDARHFCYACILHEDKSYKKANDDGEPSGTAGLPILNQCLSYDVTNILVVVVRYFGGVKLGVPGLIHAYKTAAKEALKTAEIIELEPQKQVKLFFPYEKLSVVMRIIRQYHGEIIKKTIDNQCVIVLFFSVNVLSSSVELLQSNGVQVSSDTIEI